VIRLALVVLLLATTLVTFVGLPTLYGPSVSVPPASFVKYQGNPILLPRGQGFESRAAFNPAAVVKDHRVYLLYRAQDALGISRIGLATSQDGLHFTRRAEPVLAPEQNYERRGVEDPRVVRFGSTYYLTYTAYDGHAAKLALATSKDLIHWDKRGIMLPDLRWSKSGAIVPRKVAGRYLMYFGDTDVWLATSSDLLRWDVRKEPVLRRRSGFFDSTGVEPGPPPLITQRGILLFYNGWDAAITYRTGRVLFSLEDPSVVLERTDQPLLQPTKPWELKGQVPKQVLFVEGLVNWKGVWYLYYGGGDSRIGVAIAPLQKKEVNNIP